MQTKIEIDLDPIMALGYSSDGHNTYSVDDYVGHIEVLANSSLLENFFSDQFYDFSEEAKKSLITLKASVAAVISSLEEARK